MIQRVERHIFVTREFDQICHLSKNLYNYCNYVLRQGLSGKHENIPEFTDLLNDKKYINEYALSKRLAELNQADYRALPAQTAQQVIKLLYNNWKSFYKAIKQYNTKPKLFKGRPKPPRYKDKDGKNLIIFTNQQVKIKDGLINFPKKSLLKPIKTKVDNLLQVRIVPQASCHVVEVVYTKEVDNVELDNDLYLGIDLGLDNFATVVDNTENQSFIVNGKPLKSDNQFYNKKKAKLMAFIGDRGNSKMITRLSHKRNCKVQDFLHKCSRFIVNYCIQNKIKTIVVGLNQNWKQRINIGKKNNQKFVQIPHSKFVNQLKYKAEEVGIMVIVHEESYTSKCDGLALEPIKKHENYLGRRKRRGLFQSSIGKLINADINGALNILRKVTGDSVVKQIISSGFVFNPIKIDFNKGFLSKMNNFNKIHDIDTIV